MPFGIFILEMILIFTIYHFWAEYASDGDSLKYLLHIYLRLPFLIIGSMAIVTITHKIYKHKKQSVTTV